MIIHKCDKCGTTKEQIKGKQPNLPKDWYSIRYGVNYSTHLHYELCPDCRKALKIPEEKPEETVGDRLIEILCEIMQDQIEQAD